MRKDAVCQWPNAQCQQIAICSLLLDKKLIEVCNRHFLIATLFGVAEEIVAKERK